MVDRELKQAGLKITMPRRKILEILEKASHMSAEDVYRALQESGEEVSIATIYRVLTQFEAAGLVIRHHFEGGHSVFELDQGTHHDHLVCIKCGSVEEFVDDLIEAQQKKIAKEKGYQITDHNLHIYGICAHCQQSNGG